jgi:hypothetical protein
VTAQKILTFFLLLSVNFLAAAADYQLKIIDRFVAIDNVCAWPNLTLLDDDTILAMIFSEPNHGRIDGDVQCFASTDAGKTFRYRSTPAKHTPGTNRMNFAAGLANNGDVIVLSAGWNHKPVRNFYPLPVILCRSSDKGRTWQVTSSFHKPRNIPVLTPYGNIIKIPPDKLAVCTYWSWTDPNTDTGKKHWKDVHVLENCKAYLMFSHDDGRTWGPQMALISAGCSETAPLKLNENNFLAVARTAERRIGSLKLFTSNDKGCTWHFSQSVTGKSQHPGNLLKLADGTVLLTYGNRHPPRSIKIRTSSDNGKTFSEPKELVTLNAADCGYPSTVQLKDGTIISAYYANRASYHSRYHMGIIRYKLIPK